MHRPYRSTEVIDPDRAAQWDMGDQFLFCHKAGVARSGATQGEISVRFRGRPAARQFRNSKSRILQQKTKWKPLKYLIFAVGIWSLWRRLEFGQGSHKTAGEAPKAW